jgi:hypothetical protein
MTRSWTPLGGVAPTDLTDTRLQLHRAAQVPAAVAGQLIPKAADDSHASLSWSPDDRALETQPIPGTHPLHIALEPAAFRLTLLRDGARESEFDLNGATIDDSYGWVESVLREHGALGDDDAVSRSDLDLGTGPGSGTQPFAFDRPDAFEEFARWFGNAALVLEGVIQAHPGASPVRCWPHHFDIAVLIKLDDGAGEDARTVGVGMTPGDDAYAEPYLYVTPWPYPDATATLPALTAGTWHREGWTGAVLTARDIVGADDDAQERVVRAYLDEAIRHSRSVLRA